MKILWLSNIPLPKITDYLNMQSFPYGGWMVGLSEDLIKNVNMTLVVLFPQRHSDKIMAGQINNLNFYGFYKNKQSEEKAILQMQMKFELILKEEKPDIIHIFGTEHSHTLAMVNACERLNLLSTTIISIQGLVSVYSKHYYANLPAKVYLGYTLRDFIKYDTIVLRKKIFEARGNFEIEALKKVKYVIGRTDWDKACISQINPSLRYYFNNESLRANFYKFEWDINKCEKHSIFLSQGTYPIKGLHYMLEALPSILASFPNTHLYVGGQSIVDVTTWKRDSYAKYILQLINKNKLYNNVTFLGPLNELDMCQRYKNSHIFVCPSSIENSPNSVGEAMILGVPVVTSDVGGVKNMLTHGEEGFVYQADAPYMLAHYVCEIFGNDELALKFSEKAREHALITHDRKKNLNDLLAIYNSIGFDQNQHEA